MDAICGFVAAPVFGGYCMSVGDRNAAIWFAADGYDPKKGVNGRRMAGESLLRGWFRHAQVEEFVSISQGATEAAAFADMAKDCGVTVPVRSVRLDQPRGMAPVGTIFYSAPNFATECWRRATFGATAWSLIGMTHTMSTLTVQEGALALRTAPSAEWDAVICTSRAVRSAMDVQYDRIDGYLAARFGGVVPPRPQLPIIPLGVECDEFTPLPAEGAALRVRLNIPAEDIVALIVARLTPHEKFDPLPMYLALAQAQAGMDAGRRLHLILLGNSPDDYSRNVFIKGAAALMPAVGFHVLAHEGPALRLAALSAADMFLFPIDNLQESFGIAPVEAMAAGLPCVVSDWDGLRDTVVPETGFLIPTMGARAEHTAQTGLRYMGATDSYIQFLSQMSAVTQIDVPKMAQAILALARNPDLRAAMGAAGRARARARFDWRAVVPQMQDLFAEVTAIRNAADPARFAPLPAARLPNAPTPMVLFGSFPTRQIKTDATRYVATDIGTRPGVADTLALRNYMGTKRTFEQGAAITALHSALVAGGATGQTVAELAARAGQPVLRAERILLWLLKYHFAAEEAPPQ
jgi:glycosyltransferase involved in cell wall biosynthesis